MRVEYDLGAVAPLGPAALTIGVFDGVHRGHQRLLERTHEIASAERLRAVAVTFWPHPIHVLRPEAEAPLLTTLDERMTILRELNLLDVVVVLPFTPELAALPPDAFLDRVAAFCEPRALVEGTDFALGHNRTGDVAFLTAAGGERGFTVETHVVTEGGERISSSRIRALVRSGDVAGAATLLGRPYVLAGDVMHGDQRGRLLGFPTANLRPDPRKALPANGVYAVRARLPGEAEARHPAVCNIGVRPTFGGEPRLLVEVHLLDVAGGMDLYDLPLAVELAARLREERRFGGIDELKSQIARDADRARALLAGGLPVA